MDKKLKQGMKWLENETAKDQLEIQTYKSKIIESLKNLDKEELFKKNKKQNLTLAQKVFKIFKK